MFSLSHTGLKNHGRYVGPMERQARVKLLVQLSQEMCFDVADVVDLVEYSNGFTGVSMHCDRFLCSMINWLLLVVTPFLGGGSKFLQRSCWARHSAMLGQ